MRAALIVLASAALPGQNLLRWDAWKLTGSQPNASFVFSRTHIGYEPNAIRPGFEQTITIPESGYYQLHLSGHGGFTGLFWASWTVDSHRVLVGHSVRRQLGGVVRLTAGRVRVAFETTSCGTCWGDRWTMSQPLLRRVIDPAIYVNIADETSGPEITFESPAHVLLLAMRRTSSPIRIPGFGHGLELDLSSVNVTLAVSGSGRLRTHWYGGPLWGSTVGPFYLQAVRLGPTGTFGSRVYVSSFWFRRL